MSVIPAQGKQFAALVRSLFSTGEEADAASGLRIRYLRPGGGPLVTMAYLPDLVPPGDLRELVLKPLAAGPAQPPQVMAMLGRFPAPDMAAAAKTDLLLEGLLDGKVAVHVDGHPEALLISSGQAENPVTAFGPDLGGNRALIRRALRSPAVRFLSLTAGGEGTSGPGSSRGRVLIAYVAGQVNPTVVQAAVNWAATQQISRTKLPWWLATLNLLRLPPVTEAASPEAAAAAMRQGYILLLTDRLPAALIGPVTIPLLLGVPTDLALFPAARVWNGISYLVLAFLALIQDASFVALTSYHHAMLPGPFLVTLAAGRQDAPLPLGAEVVLLEWIDNGLWSLALRVGDRRWTLLSLLILVTTILVGLRSELISPGAAMVGVGSAFYLALLPTPGLTRHIRLWRFVVLAAAAGIGMFGVALILVVLLIYLGQETHFRHPLRAKPEVAAP